MKIGIRTPSVKKMAKARTTGKVNRTLKSSINPLYGKKGMGVIKDPKKAVYNKVYNKTTVSAKDVYNQIDGLHKEQNIIIEPKQVKFNTFNLIAGILGTIATLGFFMMNLKFMSILMLIITIVNFIGYLKTK